jgi:hypothetical protein
VKLRGIEIISDAWRLWRADWEVLTAIAGLFVFLPQLATALLIPTIPDTSKLVGVDPASPAFETWRVAMEAWVQAYAIWWFLAFALAAFGQFALVAFYMAASRASVAEALLAALRSFPRFLLASIIWGLPLGFLSLLFMLVPFLLLPVLAILMARMLLVGPEILATRSTGAVAAVARSFTLTKGNTLALAGLVLTIIIVQVLVSAPMLALDTWLTANAPNPIARALVDAALAGEQMLAGIAMALLQVVAYRRLNSS